MPNSDKKTPHIVNNDLYESLIAENKTLRKKLIEVSAVGATMMFHTHRSDCINFTRDFLKSLVSVGHEVKVQDLQSMYQDGYDLASKPSVLEQFHSSR